LVLAGVALVQNTPAEPAADGNRSGSKMKLKTVLDRDEVGAGLIDLSAG
jgi:hypothetical protein